MLVEQGDPKPAADLAAEGGNDAQGRFVGLQQGIEPGNGVGWLASQQGIAHGEGAGGLTAHQGLHGGEGDGIGVEAELFKLAGEAGAVVADGIGKGCRCGWLQLQPQLPGRAAHQLHLAGAVPDGWQGKALLAGLASLHQLLQGFGGAQPGIRLAGTHQHQMAAIRHLGQGGFETLGQLSWALAAKRTALQHHHAAAGAKGRRAGLLEGLGRLAGVVAIEAAEVDGGPAGIHLRLHQRFDGTVAGSLVVAPEQVNGHGWCAVLRSAGR